MLQVKVGKRKVVASALTFCFFLQQSFCLQVLATNITGTGVTQNGNTYNITPDGTNGDIGFRKGSNFELSKGDVANFMFYDDIQGKDISTFLNLIDNQVNINGIVNALNKNGGLDSNGHVVFISPKGMVVGSSGVLNVGSLSVYTPDTTAYEKYKSNVHRPSVTSAYADLAKGTGTVKIDGNVLARNFVNIDAANVEVSNGALVMSGVNDATKLISNAQAKTLFDTLVNTNNLNANAYTNSNGSIKIVSYGADGGTNIAGTMKNFGTGDIQVTNSGSKGIDVSGITSNYSGNTLLVNSDGSINVSGTMNNQNGVLSLDNTGDGILIASTGLLNNKNGNIVMTNTGADGVTVEYGGLAETTDDANITNSGKAGINVKGQVKGKNVNVDNKNSNVVLGYDNGSNYISATDNVNIKINNGNLLNYGTKATLIKTDKGNLNVDVTNGSIGTEVGPCDGDACTGIGTDARDLKKSINTQVAGNVKAISSGTNSLVNIASLNTNLNVDQIKSDGRVILLADDGANKGSKAYDIVNRATDSNNPNVEGTGISIIASGNIGETNKALTFRQNGVSPIFNGDDATKPHVVTDVDKSKYGVDMLAIKDINVKGLDSADGNKVNTNVCAMISRTGDINAEFSGDVYIRETTANNNIDITTRGKNMYIENL
jgi:hypothetical protein